MAEYSRVDARRAEQLSLPGGLGGLRRGVTSHGSLRMSSSLSGEVRIGLREGGGPQGLGLYEAQGRVRTCCG